ncbi:hypothetical protein O1611_g2939 [Lasiodiplodia mahajangana]|uniref:Uncharacterized protein n=1 Tax=Lasiodiplodia mahajangana TaxID=1108764 RepID=A0ACC2JT83_9PEZI|nr:hypothetical protein O1611_g2939 [Lasiodiplodia mahajangana]
MHVFKLKCCERANERLSFEEFEARLPETKKRNVTVKFAFSEPRHRNAQVDGEIENERRWLTMLQGSKNIIKTLDHEADGPKISRPALVSGHSIVVTDPCPSSRTRDIVEFDGANFRTVFRACAGFSYPPLENGDRETIPADGVKESFTTIYATRMV